MHTQAVSDSRYVLLYQISYLASDRLHFSFSELYSICYSWGNVQRRKIDTNVQGDFAIAFKDFFGSLDSLSAQTTLLLWQNAASRLGMVQACMFYTDTASAHANSQVRHFALSRKMPLPLWRIFQLAQKNFEVPPFLLFTGHS